MTEDYFERIPVWCDSVELCVRIFKLTDGDLFDKRPGLAIRLQRAVLLIPGHIAEGFELGHTDQLIDFLCRARGTAGLVATILRVAERLEESGGSRVEIRELSCTTRSISRQLGSWAQALGRADIDGRRMPE